jgi:hypothetical protein
MTSLSGSQYSVTCPWKNRKGKHFSHCKNVSFNTRTWSLDPPAFTDFPLKKGLRYTQVHFKTGFTVRITLKRNVLNTFWQRSCGLRSPSWCIYDKHDAETCCFCLLSCSLRQQLSLKHGCMPITHWVTTQNAAVWIFTGVKDSNLVCISD